MNACLRHTGVQLHMKSQIVKVSVAQLCVLLSRELGHTTKSVVGTHCYWERKAASIFSWEKGKTDSLKNSKYMHKLKNLSYV